MQELLPGLFHWYAVHPDHGQRVSCHHVERSGTTIDPLLPDEGIEWFDDHSPRRVVLSTRHHLRHAEQIAQRYGCPILAQREGLHEFADGPEVEGFDFGQRLADDVTALEMDAISPDDTALLIEAEEGALLFADSVINQGGLGFVPDGLIGDDPEAVKAKIRERARVLLDEDFDHLLFAHGDPVIGGGREALRAFANRY
jgi:glyoxylase-like metal-dependent hydrolase (beta-lactamase superfamily II)